MKSSLSNKFFRSIDCGLGGSSCITWVVSSSEVQKWLLLRININHVLLHLRLIKQCLFSDF